MLLVALHRDANLYEEVLEAYYDAKLLPGLSIPQIIHCQIGGVVEWSVFLKWGPQDTNGTNDPGLTAIMFSKTNQSPSPEPLFIKVKYLAHVQKLAIEVSKGKTLGTVDQNFFQLWYCWQLLSAYLESFYTGN